MDAQNACAHEPRKAFGEVEALDMKVKGNLFQVFVLLADLMLPYLNTLQAMYAELKEKLSKIIFQCHFSKHGTMTS